MFDIEENLKKLPDSPGVYIHKDKLGQVIYVGKAVSLRNRVRQYFRLSKNADRKVRALAENIEEFEYITCGTEMEALILECNLIKKYMPKYNVLLRDDKTYPYIKVTLNEEYPRVIKTRVVENDGGKYFGPYSDAKAVNEIVDLVNDLYMLKRCAERNFRDNARPCLNFHIEKCRGICSGGVSPAKYRESINEAIEFLNGKHKKVLDMLSEEMMKAAEVLDFETAAKCRDRIAAVNAISELQRVTIIGAGDMDMVLVLRGAQKMYAVIFYVRDGKLSGRESFNMQADESDKNEAIAAQFIKQYYADATMIPKEIIVEEELTEGELIEGYLSQLSGRNVKIVVPKKGDKKALLELARRDVTEMAKTIDERAKAARERSEALTLEITKALHDLGYDIPGIGGRQYRAEAYDISNTNGIDSVGAMVVFEGSKPVKKDYRRFKIRTVEGPNDYGSLQEVIYRRFRRAEAGDAGFVKIPDFLLIDGGQGQVSAVSQILGAMRIDIPVIGMAKDDHHRTRALVSVSGKEIPLSERALLFKYTGTIQEEVHRFAIEYHRGLRGKRMLTSVLDEIEGIGQTKRNALLTYFGSVENVKKARLEELVKVPGITERNAEKIREYFNCKK
ncbi:MAG: excinuclease ABC subunit UvrC [Clostridiales bacterium]|nr:excinuclease ABC subunit UvrC [Clostridiales bacterium]